jgi:hypothetical protein
LIDGGGKAAGDLANHSNLRSRSRSLVSGKLVGCKISVLSLARGGEANNNEMGFYWKRKSTAIITMTIVAKEDGTVRSVFDFTHVATMSKNR